LRLRPLLSSAIVCYHLLRGRRSDSGRRHPLCKGYLVTDTSYRHNSKHVLVSGHVRTLVSAEYWPCPAVFLSNPRASYRVAVYSTGCSSRGGIPYSRQRSAAHRAHHASRSAQPPARKFHQPPTSYIHPTSSILHLLAQTRRMRQKCKAHRVKNSGWESISTPEINSAPVRRPAHRSGADQGSDHSRQCLSLTTIFWLFKYILYICIYMYIFPMSYSLYII
jgi:hypothetical protein